MAEPLPEVNAPEPRPQPQPVIKRFTIAERVEHWVFITSFTVLAITGLVQKFPLSPISDWFVNGVVGGIENDRLIHHSAAVVMLICIVYHIGAVGYRVFVQQKSMTMLPSLFDVRRALDALGYYYGFTKKKPQQARYTFEEKIEYFAVVWGTVIMVITGAIMWNPITWTRIFPGQVVPAAKYAHGAEAILAVLSILIWHFYSVLIKTRNKSMFNGKLNEEQMLDEHPLEFADIKAGITQKPVDPVLKRKRSIVFWPVYGVIAVVGLTWILWFSTHETTALATLPQPIETVAIFVPLTPTPLPTPRPTSTSSPLAATSWEGGIGELLNAKCTGCHNPTTNIGGLDLTSYAGLTAGGQTGAVIQPGDSQNSLLVKIQTAGGHPGQLTSAELEQIKNWIDAGAEQ